MNPGPGLRGRRDLRRRPGRGNRADAQAQAPAHPTRPDRDRPVAKAQRWDPAEVVRALLAEEAAGRDASNLRTRRQRAAFPTGKTFHIWNEDTSSIPAPTQSALRTLEWVGRRENLCVVGPEVIWGSSSRLGRSPL
ncbi:ATP-binding protein [Streptomyces sp. NPDC057557]|uniref:ATP-binding protein n=1 Tax=Streptomyces sp. NPDC057557 TaxID=3346167 RepID=UPI00368B0273